MHVRMATWLIGAVLIGTMATGCGGREAVQYADAEQLAAAIGCDSFQADDPNDPSDGTCTLANDSVALMTSDTYAEFNAGLLGVSSFAGIAVLVGNYWLVIGDPATLEAIRDHVGGEVQIT